MAWGDRYSGTDTSHVSGPRKKGAFGSNFTAVQRQTPPKKKGGGHHGVLGFAQNLGEDIGSAVLGIGPGLVKSVEHPIGAAKAIGKSYAQTYGPLTHGDLGEFLHNLCEHPLGPILDVATVVTLGGAGAAKAGGALAKAGVVSKTSRLAKLGERESLTLRSPAVRAGQEGKTVSKFT